MDPLFHLVFAFIAGMAVNVRLDHRPIWVLIVSFLALSLDVDHFLAMYPDVKILHTVIVTAGVPLLLFVTAYIYEKERDSIRLQSLVILLFVMLNGHLVADVFDEGAVALFYPASDVLFSVPETWVLELQTSGWMLISRDGVALLIYGGIIGLAYYVEEVVYFVEARHEGMRDAIRDAVES